jgi:CHAT domain-containing protein/tetratricopeptide (TPR) repeat protein
VTRLQVGAIGCALILAIGFIAFATWQRPASDGDPDAEALIVEGLYDRAEVSARTHVNRTRSVYGDDSLQSASAADVLVKALILNGRGTSDETLALATGAVRAKEALLGARHADVAPSLLNLGDVLAERAEFDQAIAITERAVTLREASTGPNSIDTADALDHLGAVLSTARRHADALTSLQKSLAIKEKAPDEAIATTLEHIGLVLQRRGEYEKSGAPLHRAAAIRQTTQAGHPAYVRTLNLIAQQLAFEGQLIESRNVSERAVAAAEGTLRPDHPTLALSLRYLAATHLELGDLSRSNALGERALAIAERNFGANHHETAPYLYLLGSAALREGAYATGRQRYQRVLDIFEARYGSWHPNVASTLSALARADARLGDYSGAKREQSRALAIHERAGGPDHPYVAVALTELAAIYRAEGSTALALPLLERALTIRETTLGRDNRDVARTLAEMAATLQEVGKTTEAQAAATRAVDIWERLDAPSAPDYATALALYAELQLRRGDYASAQSHYYKAMAIRARVFGLANPVSADTQAGLALALAKVGDYDAALRNAVRAETTGRDHLRTMLRSLPERQSLEYAAVRPRALDLMLSLTGSTQEAAESSMDGVIRGRALVLDEMATRQRSRTSAESTDPLWLAFSSAQQRLANLVVRGPDQLSSDRYAAVLEDARRESERTEQAFAERNAQYRAERSRSQLGLDDIKAALPPESVLVSFVLYERTLFNEPAGIPPRNGHVRSSSPAVRSYLAFIMRRGQPLAVIPLGPALTIDSLVSKWRADIAAEAVATSATTSGESGPLSRVSGSALRQLVWDRLASHMRDVKRVFIVPDGTLSLVPFAALPVARDSYLLEVAPVLHYLSAERDLVPTSIDTGPVGHGLLALGGPAFDDATVFGAGQSRPGQATNSPAATTRSAAPCDSVQTMTFPSLKGTLQEVRELSGLWSTSAIVSDEESRVLVGREATEPTLKKEAHRYRVLHFATHGFFVRDTCASAQPGTRAVGGLVNMSNPQYAALTAENPLLLSGLALAGANRRQTASPTEDDGILTAEEVASLNLAGVEWAVLSACGTGLGQIRTGEGVFGLRRAFQIAGARTVIMSLWSVEDDATRVWMQALYEGRLKRNLNTADAMHEASLRVLRARRDAGQSTDPFFWAAFVAAGDWH